MRIILKQMINIMMEFTKEVYEKTVVKNPEVKDFEFITDIRIKPYYPKPITQEQMQEIEENAYKRWKGIVWANWHDDKESLMEHYNKIQEVEGKEEADKWLKNVNKRLKEQKG